MAIEVVDVGKLMNFSAPSGRIAGNIRRGMCCIAAVFQGPNETNDHQVLESWKLMEVHRGILQ